ncbi:MAG: carbamoyl phosphate synthase small subunit [Omnitrophica WOR_2 bacterium RIFCSPHIGHO2_02_FULL_67_20]|nr:MAG: carbamoyl phosphate synthase small subunit [Omnitrophica WOR_2 bacterium RIFCSPHIGHO2_02_FULL_67_20]
MTTRTQTAWLVLEDGTAFPGRSVGAAGEAFGEAVFNTSMTGYQEILTDPSYKGQVVAMTYPHIGNYGVNDEDAESRRPWVEGFVMRELSPVASNFRSVESLEAYLKRHNVVALDGVDTRALTLKLREQGSMRCGISTTEPDPEELLARVRASPDIVGVDLVKEVTCQEPYDWPRPSLPVCAFAGSRVEETTRQRANAPTRQQRSVVVMDFGVKYGILRRLAAAGCRVTVVPAATPVADILARKPDGVVLSNGPGDPAAVPYAVETIRALMGEVPMLGICLGHQLLGLACGGETFKLKFGHHGGNHPVQDLATGKVEITTQNHNFAVRLDTIPGGRVEETHANLNDGTLEGMRHAGLPIFSLQYHPEASPGPHDARYMFGRFKELLAAQ